MLGQAMTHTPEDPDDGAFSRRSQVTVLDTTTTDGAQAQKTTAEGENAKASEEGCGGGRKGCTEALDPAVFIAVETFVGKTDGSALVGGVLGDEGNCIAIGRSPRGLKQGFAGTVRNFTRADKGIVEAGVGVIHAPAIPGKQAQRTIAKIAGKGALQRISPVGLVVEEVGEIDAFEVRAFALHAGLALSISIERDLSPSDAGRAQSGGPCSDGECGEEGFAGINLVSGFHRWFSLRYVESPHSHSRCGRVWHDLTSGVFLARCFASQHEQKAESLSSQGWLTSLGNH